EPQRGQFRSAIVTLRRVASRHREPFRFGRAPPASLGSPTAPPRLFSSIPSEPEQPRRTTYTPPPRAVDVEPDERAPGLRTARLGNHFDSRLVLIPRTVQELDYPLVYICVSSFEVISLFYVGILLINVKSCEIVRDPIKYVLGLWILELCRVLGLMAKASDELGV
ncbi:Unknown protein, partial [Striga hermonthica]